MQTFYKTIIDDSSDSSDDYRELFTNDHCIYVEEDYLRENEILSKEYEEEMNLLFSGYMREIQEIYIIPNDINNIIQSYASGKCEYCPEKDGKMSLNAYEFIGNHYIRDRILCYQCQYEQIEDALYAIFA